GGGEVGDLQQQVRRENQAVECAEAAAEGTEGHYTESIADGGKVRVEKGHVERSCESGAAADGQPVVLRTDVRAAQFDVQRSIRSLCIAAVNGEFAGRKTGADDGAIRDISEDGVCSAQRATL